MNKILLGVVILFFTSSVSAQVTPFRSVVFCTTDNDQVLGALRDHHGEELVLIGINSQNTRTISLYHNDITGSFTLIATDAKHTCIVAAGLQLSLVNDHNFDPNKYKKKGVNKEKEI